MAMFDPLAQDPPVDADFPPSVAQITFPSSSAMLIGTLLTAQGKGSHPTVLLLHGFPGTQQNADLAYPFQRAGWNVLVFHYRGAWGSQGNFTFGGCIDDVAACLAYLRQADTAQKFNIDRGRIALVGHSMGGFDALMTAARDADILWAASFGGFNFGVIIPWLLQDEANQQMLAREWEENVVPLHGTSSMALVQETITAGSSWDLRLLGPALRQKYIYLIGAARDTIAPPSLHHNPLIAAYQEAGVAHLQHDLLDADHGFSQVRVQLTRMLLRWLAERIEGS